MELYSSVKITDKIIPSVILLVFVDFLVVSDHDKRAHQGIFGGVSKISDHEVH
jgi:hypothetical protein